MADYDPRCVNCFHRSHEGKPCINCDPKNRCAEFVRADLFIARSMARIEGFLQQSHGQMMMAMSTIFDLLAEVSPDAAEKLKVKLEERQAASEAAMKEQQEAAAKEADEAFAAATKAEQEKAMEELAEGYVKDNVLPFPATAVATSPADLMGCDEDPAPEVV